MTSVNSSGKCLGGFTLIEVLIAMSIFAILSVMTFRALDGVLDMQGRVEEHAENFTAFQVSWTVILQDFTNLVRRPIRGVFGDLQQAFYLEDSDCSVTFTRASGEGDVSFSRSSMKRISYCLENGDLYRVVWPTLDRVQANEPQKGLLIEDVDNFSIEIDPPLLKIGDESDNLNITFAQYELIPVGKIIVEIETSEGVFRRSFLASGIQ